MFNDELAIMSFREVTQRLDKHFEWHWYHMGGFYPPATAHHLPVAGRSAKHVEQFSEPTFHQR